VGAERSCSTGCCWCFSPFWVPKEHFDVGCSWSLCFWVSIVLLVFFPFLGAERTFARGTGFRGCPLFRHRFNSTLLSMNTFNTTRSGAGSLSLSLSLSFAPSSSPSSRHRGGLQILSSSLLSHLSIHSRYLSRFYLSRSRSLSLTLSRSLARGFFSLSRHMYTCIFYIFSLPLWLYIYTYI
jgi:hypothetical protein